MAERKDKSWIDIPTSAGNIADIVDVAVNDLISEIQLTTNEADGKIYERLIQCFEYKNKKRSVGKMMEVTEKMKKKI